MDETVRSKQFDFNGMANRSWLKIGFDERKSETSTPKSKGSRKSYQRFKAQTTPQAESLPKMKLSYLCRDIQKQLQQEESYPSLPQAQPHPYPSLTPTPPSIPLTASCPLPVFRLLPPRLNSLDEHMRSSISFIRMMFAEIKNYVESSMQIVAEMCRQIAQRMHIIQGKAAQEKGRLQQEIDCRDREIHRLTTLIQQLRTPPTPLQSETQQKPVKIKDKHKEEQVNSISDVVGNQTKKSGAHESHKQKHIQSMQNALLNFKKLIRARKQS